MTTYSISNAAVVFSVRFAKKGWGNGSRQISIGRTSSVRKQSLRDAVDFGAEKVLTKIYGSISRYSRPRLEDRDGNCRFYSTTLFIKHKGKMICDKVGFWITAK